MAPSIVAVCGGLNMDIVIETDQIPYTGESMDANSLANFSGGKGANTAVAAYRASHLKAVALLEGLLLKVQAAPQSTIATNKRSVSL